MKSLRHPPHNTIIMFEFAKVRPSNLIFQSEFFEEFYNLIIIVWCIDVFTYLREKNKVFFLPEYLKV